MTDKVSKRILDSLTEDEAHNLMWFLHLRGDDIELRMENWEALDFMLPKIKEWKIRLGIE